MVSMTSKVMKHGALGVAPKSKADHNLGHALRLSPAPSNAIYGITQAFRGRPSAPMAAAQTHESAGAGR